MIVESVLVEREVAESKTALPGDSGVWVFIFADMCAFAVFFALFSYGRFSQPALYEVSRQQLDLWMGLANTLILLTSGGFMAAAPRSARLGNAKATLYNLLVTLGVGSLFGVSKAMEWSAKIDHGIGLTTNEFFTYYFVFTGIHFLHFVIGIGVLLVLISRVRGATIDSANLGTGNLRTANMRLANLQWIEAGGAYWHMVDLLWIVLFAMLYLMRAA